MKTFRILPAVAVLVTLFGAAPALTAPGDFLATFGEGVLDNPLNLDTDADGNLYVCDYGHGDLKVFDPSFNLLMSWNSTHPDREYPQYDIFLNPHTITVHGDRVYVANSGQERVEAYLLSGPHLFDIVAPATGATYSWQPSALATDAAGNLYVTDVNQDGGRVVIFNPDGVFLRNFGGPGQGDGQFLYPSGIALDREGRIYVSDNYQVQVFANDGTFLRRLEGDFSEPEGIAVDRNGRVYLADFLNNRIQVYSSDGSPIAVWMSDLVPAMTPTGLTLDETNNRLYVADMWNNRFQVFEAFPVSPGDDSVISEFLPPVSLDKQFEAGSTIPVKFRLTDAGGAPAVANVVAVRLRNGQEQLLGTPVSTAPGTGIYHYNLSTRGLAAGLWTLAVTLVDGTEVTKAVVLR